MAKAYWIAQVDIEDPEAYKDYVAANALPFAKFGAKFLARGGGTDVVEGHYRSRIVILEFPDLATARACYESPDYAPALELRKKASSADIVIVEGYDGPQPGDG